MGSDETAITIPGGPRVIDVFDGNGAPSGPKCTLFSGVDRLLAVSRVGLVVGKRLYRIRRRCSSLVLSESPGSKPWPITAKAEWSAERIRLRMLQAAAYAA